MDDITKSLFKDFVDLQLEGSVNMLDARGVCSAIFCCPKQHKEMIRNYKKYSEKFGTV